MKPLTFATACELARRAPLYDARMERLIEEVEHDPSVDSTDEFCNALADYAQHMDANFLAKALEPLFAHYGLLPSPEETLIKVLAEVRAERRRQFEKWGQQDHPSFPADRDLSVAALNMKYAKLIVENTAAAGGVSFQDILYEEIAEAFAAESERELRAELIQVAATAVAWVEAIDRRKYGKAP